MDFDINVNIEGDIICKTNNGLIYNRQKYLQKKIQNKSLLIMGYLQNSSIIRY